MSVPHQTASQDPRRGAHGPRVCSGPGASRGSRLLTRSQADDRGLSDLGRCPAWGQPETALEDTHLGDKGCHGHRATTGPLRGWGGGVASTERRQAQSARQGKRPERRSTWGRRGGRRAGTPSRSPKSEQGGGSHPPGEVRGQPVPAHRPEGGSSEEAEARDSPRKKDPPLGCKDLPAGVALETLRHCEVQGQPLSARRPGDVSSAAPGPQRPHRRRGKLRAAGVSACGGGQRGLRDASSS